MNETTETGSEQPTTQSAARETPGGAGTAPGLDLEKRLNQVATTLIGATAGVTALFALLGANSDRVWVLLDDSSAKKFLVLTVAFALIAIVLGLQALLSGSSRVSVRLLAAGSAAFVTSLVFAVWTAAAGANQFSRPSFSKVGVDRSSPDSTSLTFTVRAPSLDGAQRIGVRVTDQGTGLLRFFDATLARDEHGVAQQEVSLSLPRSSGVILLAAWHRDNSPSGSPEPRCSPTGPPPDGTACVTVVP